MRSNKRVDLGLALIWLGTCVFAQVGSEPRLPGPEETSPSANGPDLSTEKLLNELDEVTKKESKGLLETHDGNPEFQVRVKEWKDPMCFQLNGEDKQVFRLVQDRQTGITVNARLLEDHVINRTYIGAIIIIKGTFRVLAKQHIVMVNKERFKWGQLQATTFQGHRVLIDGNRVIVAFKKHQVILEIRRSFLEYPKPNDNRNIFTTSEPEVIDFPDPTVQEGDADSLVDIGSEDYSYPHRKGPKADIMPVVHFPDDDDPARNSASSPIGWTWLFSWAGTNHRPVQESLTQGDDSREGGHHASRVSREVHPWSDHGTGNPADPALDPIAYFNQNPQNRRLVRQLHRQMKSSRRSRDNGRSRYRSRHASVRRFRKGRYKEMGSAGRSIFLGLYILEGKGFSNTTHGLLGQFLHKSVTSLKLNWGKSESMQAVFMVHGAKERKATAVYMARQHVAGNTTRPCWVLSHNGRHVIDGTFPDYLVHHIRYSSPLELPPPASL